MSRDYWKWVRGQAALLESDGCSKVKDIHVECCFEHDIAYRTHRDPQVAFEKGWDAAPPITRREVDRRFRKCNQKRSKLRWFSPLAAWRWVGVRLAGDFDKDPQKWLDRLGAKSSPSPECEEGE